MNTTFSLNQYRKYHPVWMQNETGRTYLELSLTFVTIVFFGWFALRPTFNTISELLGDLESLDVVNQKLDTKIDALAAAQIVYEEAEPRLELLSQALPEKAEVAEFMARAEILAIENQVELISTDFDEFELISKIQTPEIVSGSEVEDPDLPAAQVADLSPKWKEVDFMIEVKGTYEQIEAFTIALVKLRQMTLIDQLVLKLDGEGEGESSALTLSLRGNLLFY